MIKYIISAPVQSGKTTCLQQFILNKNCCGILCPDINGLRQVYNIELDMYVSLQLDYISPSEISIGKYNFSVAGFNYAQEILWENLNSNADYYIIDEVGKLELNNKGLEPMLSKILTDEKIKKFTLIIVIRDYLLKNCLEHYNLQDAIVMNIEEFKSKFD
jgi:nucleoside-triphosphatase THEP1